MTNHLYCAQDSVHPLVTEYYLTRQSCIFLTAYTSTAINCMKKSDLAAYKSLQAIRPAAGSIVTPLKLILVTIHNNDGYAATMLAVH